MTTIAYKDGVMAGDSAATYDGSLGARVRKVFRSKRGDLVGFCGEVFLGPKIEKWVKGGCRGRVPDLEGAGSAIWVKPDGKVHLIENETAVEAEGPFFAIGSGHDIARGAMAAGASATLAVEIACALDAGTGGPVMSVALDTSETCD